MLTQYCSEDIRIVTPLDTDKVTNAVLTIEQGNIQLNINQFEHPEFGVFLAHLTGTQMSQFVEGTAKAQLRGFVDGEEFATNIYSIWVKPVLLKEVIIND